MREHRHFTRNKPFSQCTNPAFVAVIYCELAVAAQPAQLMQATGTLKDTDTHTQKHAHTHTHTTPNKKAGTQTQGLDATLAQIQTYIRESYQVTFTQADTQAHIFEQMPRATPKQKYTHTIRHTQSFLGQAAHCNMFFLSCVCFSSNTYLQAVVHYI